MSKLKTLSIFDDKDMKSYTKKLEEIKIMKDETWAIYGTGNGAELIFSLLCDMGKKESIKYIIERDEKVHSQEYFHDIPIRALADIIDYVDGIIIAAVNSHAIIKKRVLNSLNETQQNNIRLIDIFTYYTDEENREYIRYIEQSILRKDDEFVAFDEKEYIRKVSDTKIIAWYLPQFHQISINNIYYGQGFTEWTNTTRAIPMFAGHYQPHIPYDVGYYDLLNPDTFKRQVYLAKHYGIYGFCFHYYWFSGKKIMEKPIEMFLEHKEIEMPFCINWATESWSASWDGGSNEMMFEQKLNEGDGKKFMEDILPYMKDSRYIRIDGKPLLVIYRIDVFEKESAKNLLSEFRKYAKKEGYPDLYIMLTNAYGFSENAEDWGADAISEFPAHVVVALMERYRPRGYLNPYFNGTIRDASAFIKDKRYLLKHNSKKFFRSALTSWDNTARKAVSQGLIIQGLNPGTFKQWLRDIMVESRQIHSESENIVFVNSWNEWAEGSHLEPDMRYGYGYLQALKEAIIESR